MGFSEDLQNSQQDHFLCVSKIAYFQYPTLQKQNLLWFMFEVFSTTQGKNVSVLKIQTFYLINI